MAKRRKMNKAEWLEATDPVAMMDHLRDMPNDKQSERKFRLFACACCRLIWVKLPDEVCRQSVETAERYTDGLATAEEYANGAATAEELRAASHAAHEYWRLSSSDMTSGPEHASFAAYNASCVITPIPLADAQMGAWGAAKHTPLAADTKEQQFATTSAVTVILRDIFGNPFRPVAVDPAWLTSDVLAIAAGIYRDKAFDRMPILADALQDAGCGQEDVLNHCRQPGEHVRGCWVIDLLTGRK